MENIVEFFRNLPKKQCRDCGQILVEQCECYVEMCEKCEKKEEERS